MPLSALAEWPYHPRFGSRQRHDHFAALALTAAQPDAVRPIVVLAPVDGVHPIYDGRFLYFALNKAHDGNDDVEVRCVLYAGTEAQGVEAVCGTAVGTIEASQCRQPASDHGLLPAPDEGQGQQHADRRPDAGSASGAVRPADRAGPVADLVRQRYPEAEKAVSTEQFQAVLDRAEDIAANGKRFKSNEAFDALQVDRHAGTVEAAKPAKVKPIMPIESEPILGHDDQPVDRRPDHDLP